MRVCIVIPVYNEEAVLERNVEEILQYAQALPVSVTLVAVNDGSHDRTPQILRGIGARYPASAFHAISYDRNRGYGGAIRTGASYAMENEHDYIVFMDSDLTDHPRYLSQFCEKMAEGWDYIKTTRHVPDGGYEAVPWKRRMISSVGCAVARRMTGLPLTDLANGFRAIRVDVYRRLNLQEEGFAVIMEELSQVRKITRRCCEIPRVQGVRSSVARSSLFSYDVKTLWSYGKYLIRS